jgi:hypothetical protein
METEEIWKGIDLFEGLYEVSNLGNVRSTDYLIEVNGGCYWKKGKVLKQLLSNSREMTVSISCAQLGLKRTPYLVNRLVANAFLPNPNNFKYAIHISGDNLDNRAENLQWATATECVRKESAQIRRRSALKIAKTGTMPSENFMNNQHIGHKKSQEARRRGVSSFDLNKNFIEHFTTVKDAQAKYNLADGHIHLAIKRGENGFGKAKGYFFKFD